MRSDDFDFDLPRKLIAQHPAVPRDAARLLVVGDDLQDRGVRDLPALLRPGDVMVVNDTRVIPARLFGRRGAAHVEVTLTEPVATEPDAPANGGARWRALARPAKRLRPGDLLLMRAPGFAGRRDRPFHYLSDVTQTRLALGLRHDLRAE